MQKQSDNKVAALYYRTANNNQTDGLYLDNQMQKLLCYAKEKLSDSFILYLDALRALAKGGERV
jgi:hypothetical protein